MFQNVLKSFNMILYIFLFKPIQPFVKSDHCNNLNLYFFHKVIEKWINLKNPNLLCYGLRHFCHSNERKKR